MVYFNVVKDDAQLGRVFDVLLERCADPEPLRSAASWSVANCCDVLVAGSVAVLALPPCISAVQLT